MSASVIRTVACGILAFKKVFVKTLQIGLYSVIFLNLPIKHVQEKEKGREFDCKRKITCFYLNFSSMVTLKSKGLIFYVNFLFLKLISLWLTAHIFDVFYL